MLKSIRSRLPIGERTQALLSGLGWTAPVASLSRVLSGLATLFAARWIGPSAFGEANLALALSVWIQIPFFAGIQTALMHYLPQASREEKQPAATFGLILLTLTGLLTLVICLLFEELWARWAGVSVTIFRMAVFWTAGFGAYAIVSSCQNALEAFRARARIDLLFALIFPLLIVLSWQQGVLNAKKYIIGFAIAYAVAAALGLPTVLPGSLRGVREAARKYIKRFLSYGLLAAGNGAVAALLTTSTRLVANQYLPASDIGVLAAYQGASLQMSAFILTVGSQVFFPIASRTPDRGGLFRKIAALVIPGTLATTCLYLFLTWLSFILLGKQYPFVWQTGLIFSLAGGLATSQGFLLSFLLSSGRRGIVWTTCLWGAGGVMALIGSHFAIPRWGVVGAGFALVIAYAVNIVLCFFYRPPTPSRDRASD